MFRLIGFIYTVGIWGTFGVLVYTHWNECSGIGGCAYRVGVDFLFSLVWPLFWGGWIR